MGRFDPKNIVEFFQDMKMSYNAAKTGRLRKKRKGVSSMGSHADYHYATETEFLRMMETARDIDRNDLVVGQGVSRLVDNVIQDGFRLDPQTGDDVLNKDLQERWSDWTETPEFCHEAQELSFHMIEKLVFRHTIVDGDIILLPLENGRLETIEAHRLRTPRNTKRNVVHGVLLDDARRRLEYWLTKEDISAHSTLARVSDVKAYAARDSDGRRQVLHTYNPKRVTQTRGVTALAPTVDATGLHDDIQFAKLVQHQICSCITFFRQRDINYGGGAGTQYGPRTTESISGGGTRTIEGISPGLEIIGDPGEKLTGFSPNIPNPEFKEHAMMVLGLIAVNLGLPLHIFLLDPSQTNFSGWRGAFDQAKISFREWQRWESSFLHRPVYLWKLRQWIAEDMALRAQVDRTDVRLFRHRWNYPTWPYLEPLKDASADLLRVRNGLISPRRLHAERGRDWEDVSTEIVEDNASAIRKAKLKAQELNAEFPEDQPVHWRELLMLTAPDGVSVTVSGNGSEPSSDRGSANSIDDNGRDG